MRITLSVDALTPGLSGIGRYCWELCQYLPQHPGIEAIAFFRGRDWVSDPSQLLSGTHQKTWRWPRVIQTKLTQRKISNSLFHGPNFFLPHMAETGIITIHDLSVFRHPETHPPERIKDFERNFDRSIAKASHILTDSETMRQEIIAYTGAKPDAVTAIHLGVSPHYRRFSADETMSTLQPLGLKHDSYGLCVSTLEPRKRIGALLKAWRELPVAIRNRYPLAIAGGRGWMNDDLVREMDKGRDEGWLRLIGYIPEDALPSLYAGARLFVYPSAYEGFGLPPIEAMACGVPVIVSNRSCLPEVTQGAAMLIDPHDIGEFRQSIERGLTDDTWRTGAIEHGLEVAASYTWDRCLEQTIHVYRKTWAEYF